MERKIDTTPNPVMEDQIAALRRERDRLSAKVAALSGLIEVGMIINSAVRLDDVMRLVMEKAQSVMAAEASAVFLINEEKQVFECPVAFGEAGDKVKTIEIPLDTGIAGWVATHRKGELIPNAYRDDRFNPEVDRETGFITRSILAAPLMVRDRLIGVAEVINRKDGNVFTADDLYLFSAFCRQVAMAIDNARVHELELAQQRMSQQLASAQFIQQSFLPTSLPVAADGKFDVAAKSVAATSVGGDIYDFVAVNEQSIGLTIGDVSGKGIPAALFMARLVSDFRLYVQQNAEPPALMAALNTAICRRSSRGMFVTFFYGILDVEKGRLNFANAGHLPLLRIDKAGNAIELKEVSKGIPLGISPNFQFEEREIQLNEGDVLVLVTDGIAEAKNKAGDIYSLGKLKKCLHSLAGQSAEVMLEAILADVQKFAADTSQHDDLTVVVLKWK